MQNKTRMVGWRMPEALYKQVVSLAAREDRSFSNTLEHYIKQGLKQQKQESIANGE